MSNPPKLLRISSEDKKPGEKNSDFTVTFNNSAYVQDVVGVIVKSISFTNVFPNIFSDGGDPNDPLTKANNVFTFKINGDDITTYDVILEPAFYSATQLAQALEDGINALALGITATVALSTDVNPKFEFTIVGGTMKFLQRNDPITGDLQNRIANQIGITQDSAFVASYTADSLPSLGGLRQAYICSPELSERHTVASSNEGENIPVLTDVPINVAFGQEVFYQSYDAEVDTVIFPMAKQLTSIRIQLCTRTGRVLDLGTNALTLMVQLLK